MRFFLVEFVSDWCSDNKCIQRENGSPCCLHRWTHTSLFRVYLLFCAMRRRIFFSLRVRYWMTLGKKFCDFCRKIAPPWVNFPLFRFRRRKGQICALSAGRRPSVALAASAIPVISKETKKLPFVATAKMCPARILFIRFERENKEKCIKFVLSMGGRTVFVSEDASPTNYGGQK